jgi:hypothetical protein
LPQGAAALGFATTSTLRPVYGEERRECGSDKSGSCLLGTLVLAACAVWWRTFPNLEAISPYFDALDFGKVQTLHLTLRWKPAETQGVTYDFVIWDSGLDPAKTLPQARSNWGTIIYQREALGETSHTVETPLKPNTLYFWSVRTRQASVLGDWSTYGGITAITAYGGCARIHGTAAPFGFKTPP